MLQRRSPGSEARAPSTTPIAAAESTAGSSRQAAWWPCHEFLEAVLAQANVGPLPHAGTPAWCALGAEDPRKLLALAVAGEHHVLRVETAQTACADASRAISATADWAAVSREIRTRTEFSRQKPWMRRSR
ncbi:MULTISPECIES: DUF2742 domain-containing protein [unclassified Mycobacterium]|uniref:DUF2742 domain-containing protein n=1 Tax=unclassified Mycobacterium TaxID=2642494 RepID=UPI0009EE4724|nr:MULTISPECIES: DUF2742 domain-containing protein [unclassified Mycobacterium]